MKGLGILGSPRIGGNSDILLEQALAGAKDEGAEVEKIVLSKKKIAGARTRFHMKQLHVLVFPGGTEIGLEIQRSLKLCKEIRLCSAGLDVSNHAPFVFQKHFVVPSIHSEGWIDQLNEIILRENIDYIFPAYDDIVVALAMNQQRIGAQVVSSPLESCLITRSKTQTYNLFRNILPVPEKLTTIDQVINYPVFVKPDKGQGSQRSFIASTPEKLRVIMQENHDSIILEYLPGPEYTIDCFTDREKGLWTRATGPASAGAGTGSACRCRARTYRKAAGIWRTGPLRWPGKGSVPPEGWKFTS